MNTKSLYEILFLKSIWSIDSLKHHIEVMKVHFDSITVPSIDDLKSSLKILVDLGDVSMVNEKFTVYNRINSFK